MKRLQWLLVIASLIITGGISARADVVVRIETESYVVAQQGGKATLYIAGDRVRIDSNEGGEDYTVIYTVDQGPVYWIIDHDHGSYFELKEEDMAKMKMQIDMAIEQFGEELKRAPPEQKAYMKQVFEQKMGRPYGEDVHTQYERVSSGVKIHGWTCTQYEGLRNGKKHEEVWAADWSEAGINAADFQVFGQMAGLFEDVGQRTPAFFQFFTRDAGPEGLPVLVVTYRDGRRAEKSEVTDIRIEDLAPQLFSLPDGLTRKAMPGL